MNGDFWTNEFRFFQFLPQELQLMIWDLWREDQPVFHHYLFLTKGGRCYAALDTTTHQIVDRIAHSADPKFNDGTPSDPVEQRLQFVGDIMTVTKYRDLEDHKNAMAWDLEGLPYYPSLAPVITYLHLETDIFIFWSSYRWPGQLRFLCEPIAKEPAPDINHGDWSHQIQKVGIYVSKHTLPLCEFDRRAFSQLRHLRNLFLIIRWKRSPMPIWWPMPLWRLTSGESEVFVNPDEVIEFVETFPLPDELEQYRSQELEYLRQETTKAETLRTQLLQFFQTCSRQFITVQVVLEGLP
ncbi:hypothetical protein F4860DRAFT_517144 [Xylaria cubensis]|nr:hypothetical protein F4860DRAFT_517144 [Xylaria cubensis]